MNLNLSENELKELVTKAIDDFIEYRTIHPSYHSKELAIKDMLKKCQKFEKVGSCKIPK